MGIIKANETQEQIALIDWIKLQHPWLIDYTIHIANERACSPAQGAKLKRMGVLAGVSDILIAWPTNQFYSLWIELKIKKGRPTPSQLVFIDRMNKAGFYACICYGADEAIEVINKYISGRL